MTIEVLGTGCPKCKQLTANAEAAVKELNIQAEISKVTDIDKITEYGVMMTPGLVIDGKVVTVHETAPTPEFQARLVAGDQAVDMLTRGALNSDGRQQGRFTPRQRANVAQRLVGPGQQQQRPGQKAVRGLRSVQIIQDLSHATRIGMVQPLLADHAERDWIEGEWVDA